MEPVRLATSAMGCRWELVLAGDNEPLLRAAGEEAIEEILSAHARLSAFDPSSVVSRINAGAGQWAERVDAELLGLIMMCEHTRVATAGAFDITVGRVMETHGRPRSTCPQRAHSDARVGRITIDEPTSRVALLDAEASIDLGGVGKGFALDLAVAALRDAGVESAFLHAGTSSVATIGHSPGSEPWRVALPDGKLDLANAAMSVSGTEAQGDHLLDPRTGKPAIDRGYVVVSGPSAALCDAWSTACFVDRGAADRLPQGYHRLEGSASWTR